MAFWLTCLTLFGCGEVKAPVQTDAPVVVGDAPTGPTDSPIVAVDAQPVQETAALWLKLDDPPADGATDSAGTHVSSCTSCPTQVAGKIGNAYAFNGNRLDVAAASDVQTGTAFTLAMWVRVDAVPAQQAMIACKNFDNLNCSFGLTVSPTLVPQFFSLSDTSPNMDASATLPLGTWHHVALTWNGSLKTIYVDGAASGSGPATTISNAPARGMTLGQRPDASSPLTYPGTIDELMFFGRALSTAEIMQLATP